jgi:hypothetical protein
MDLAGLAKGGRAGDDLADGCACGYWTSQACGRSRRCMKRLESVRTWREDGMVLGVVDVDSPARYL